MSHQHDLGCLPRTARGRLACDKPKARYGIADPHVVRRASIESGGKTVIEWPVKAAYGTFPTAIAAKRSYMEGLDPQLKGSPDSFIASHFAVEQRNQRARIVRLP